MITELK